MTGSPKTPAPTPTPDTPPTSTITSPTEGATVLIGKPVAITGTASDAGGGSVVRVEVSVDGGANYSAATGTNDWSFNWTPSFPAPLTIKSRAFGVINESVSSAENAKPFSSRIGTGTGRAPVYSIMER